VSKDVVAGVVKKRCPDVVIRVYWCFLQQLTRCGCLAALMIQTAKVRYPCLPGAKVG